MSTFVPVSNGQPQAIPVLRTSGLSSTGLDSLEMVGLALLLLVGGGALATAGRRRIVR